MGHLLPAILHFKSHFWSVESETNIAGGLPTTLQCKVCTVLHCAALHPPLPQGGALPVLAPNTGPARHQPSGGGPIHPPSSIHCKHCHCKYCNSELLGQLGILLSQSLFNVILTQSTILTLPCPSHPTLWSRVGGRQRSQSVQNLDHRSVEHPTHNIDRLPYW